MGFIRKHKGKMLVLITIIMLIVIIFTSFYNKESTFIGNGISYVINPIQKQMGAFSGWIENKFSFWENAGKLEAENEELLKKIELLETENNRLKIYEAENIKLTEALELKKKYIDYPTIGAEVISKDPGNWYEIFSIDKGSNDGISSDMVVIAQSGLVGRIIESGSKYSKVISIIDDTSSVSAKNLRTGDVGMVKGDYKLRKDGMCRMESIDVDAEIIIGDEIVTSHLSEIYPKDITIGYIKEVKINSDGLTKSALIQPVVDFKHIESVLIMNGKEDYFAAEE